MSFIIFFLFSLAIYNCFVCCRFYSDAWLNEDLKKTGPHRDDEISSERMKYFRRYFFSVRISIVKF